MHPSFLGAAGITAALLSWGSFLNMVGSRLLRGESFFGRSHCPECGATIATRDLIPFFSWLWLKGHCRSCGQPISWLYPFIEIATLLIFTAIIIKVNPTYWFSYFILSSALLITVRMDLEAMLVSSWTTLYIAPIGLACAYTEILPLTTLNSLAGAISGYSFLWIVRYLFFKITKKEGMGLGDVELLAGLGAFFGLPGWWHILMIATTVGSIVGIGFLIINKRTAAEIKFAFCPFLALGAWIYLFFSHLSFWNF